MREQRIPFEISAKSAPSQDDGFYSEANQRYLEKMVALDKEGKLKHVVKTTEELEAMAR